MLERTSTCLDTAVRHAVRTHSRLARSTRLLHQSFWHHAAGELDLPPSALPLSASFAGRAQVADGKLRSGGNVQGQESSRTEDGLQSGTVFLDFLYPPPAQAMLARSSISNAAGVERWERRTQKSMASPRYREYSSLSVDPGVLEDKPTATVLAHDTLYEILPEGGPVLSQSASLQHDPALAAGHEVPEMLSRLISSSILPEERTSAVRRVWAIYKNSATEIHRQIKPRTQLLVWFSEQDDREASAHCLEIFESIGASSRTPLIYNAAVVAALHLGNTPRAMKIHHSARSLRQPVDTGGGHLMRHAVKSCKWHLATHLMRSFSKYDSLTPERITSWTRGHPDLHFIAIDLLRLLKIDTRGPVSETLNPLLAPLCVGVVSIESSRLDGPTSEERRKEAMQRIRNVVAQVFTLRLDVHRIYEECLVQLASPQRDPSKSATFSLISHIYQLYQRSPIFRPSKTLLRRMLDYWRRRASILNGPGPTRTFFGLDRIVSDWRRFHKKLESPMLYTIMDCFARLGNVKGVHLYANEYIALNPTGAGRLWPLIYVHAARADTAGASAQLQSLKDDFGVEPDLKCWNVLIYAFEQANDMDGALATFQRLRDAGLQPDAFTLGPLLSMYGQRGDVDGVSDLLDLAKELGVVPTTLMLNSRIMAEVNNGDIHAAEQALDAAAVAVDEREATGSLTICFNTIMTAYALRRDIDRTMMMYRKMKEKGVTLDSNTYAALIQALCVYRQTNAAYKILRTTMPNSRIAASALHYAICIAGYVNQGMFSDALRVHEDMHKARVRPSTSTRLAYIKAKALAEDLSLSRNPDTQVSSAPLQETIMDLMGMLDTADRTAVTKGPEPGLRSSGRDSLASTAFDFLIWIHGKRRCFDAVEVLFSRYNEQMSKDATAGNTPPVRLLTALMSAYFRAGDHDAVEQCWNLTKEQAERLRRVPLPPTSLDTSQPASDTSATNPAPSLRFILSRPLRYYVASMSASSPTSTAKMTSIVSSVLSAGYSLDNRTWNAYIVALCRCTPARALLAFTLTERFLMPAWPGWTKTPRDRRRHRVVDRNPPKPAAVAEGLSYIRARYLRPGQLVPQYKTMVYLAAALLELQRAETMGRPGGAKTRGRERDIELEAQVGSVRELRAKAPETLRAVRQLPQAFDPLQSKLIPR